MSRILKQLEEHQCDVEVIRRAAQVIADYLQLPWIDAVDELLASGANDDRSYYMEQLMEVLLGRGKFLLETISGLADADEITPEIVNLEAENPSFSRKMSELRRGIAKRLRECGYEISEGLGGLDLWLEEMWQILHARGASPTQPLAEEILNARISEREKVCAEHIRPYIAKAADYQLPLGEMEEGILCLCRHYASLKDISLASEFIVENMELGIQDPVLMYDYFILGVMAGEYDSAMQGYNVACEARPELSLIDPNRYHIEKLIYRDRISMIFYVIDSNQKPALIKVLNNPPANVRQMLRNAKKLRHGGILEVYDFLENNALRPAVVLEHFAGSSLRQRVDQSGPLGLEEWLHVAFQVAGALAHAHDQNMVHGNLNPDKLLMDGDRVKIADFGLLSVTRWPVAWEKEDLYDVYFTAPEALFSEDGPGKTADVYSLAKTMYYLLTGKLPHQMNADDVPERLWQVLKQATESEPAMRYENATKMLEDLAKAKDAAPGAPSKPKFTKVVASGSKERVIPVAKGENVLLPEGYVYRDGIVFCQADNSQMLFIPKGSFWMGSDERMTESPAHEVSLDNYLLDRYPVTNVQYARFLEYVKKSGDHSKCHPEEPSGKDHTPKGWQTIEYKKYSEADNHPVIFIDWWDAWAYAAWLGKILPTEAQWEKAAKGGEERRYPWGDEIPTPELANYGNAEGKTTLVGQYSKGASKYGCLDMAGNVWEWCRDSYSKSFYRDSPKENPVYLDNKSAARSLRGGAWNDGENSLRISCRACWMNSVRYAYVGFRCALPL